MSLNWSYTPNHNPSIKPKPRNLGWSISCDDCNNPVSARKKGGFFYTKLDNCYYCKKPFTPIKGGPVYKPLFICKTCNKPTNGDTLKPLDIHSSIAPELFCEYCKTSLREN